MAALREIIDGVGGAVRIAGDDRIPDVAEDSRIGLLNAEGAIAVSVIIIDKLVVQRRQDGSVLFFLLLLDPLPS